MDGHLLLAVFHLALVVPFFLWIGFQRTATPDWAYNVLFGLGVVILAYHGLKAIARAYAKSAAIWINLIHAGLFAPLLLWIGYQGKKTGRPAYELLLMIGFAALGYHLKSLIEVTQTFVRLD
jgi:hypothetical protein